MSWIDDGGDPPPTFYVGIPLLLFALMGGCWRCSYGCNPTYSEGERTGYVVKVSHKGYFWKSWEGSMHLAGGNQGGGGSGSDTWEFSVPDPKLAADIEQSAKEGRRVTLRYEQWMLGPLWYETPYMVKELK